MAKGLATYDESQIQHLEALEHIRLRTGMYIGRKGDGMKMASIFCSRKSSTMPSMSL